MKMYQVMAGIVLSVIVVMIMFAPDGNGEKEEVPCYDHHGSVVQDAVCHREKIPYIFGISLFVLIISFFLAALFRVQNY